MRRASLTALAVALLAACASASSAAPAAAAAPRVPVTQPLVILLQDHVARATASRRARVIEPVPARAAADEGAHRPARDGQRQRQGRQPLGACPAARPAERPHGLDPRRPDDPRRRRSGAWSSRSRPARSRSIATASSCARSRRSCPSPRRRLRTASSSSRRPGDLAARSRRPVRARHQRALGHLPGVRGRPGPDRASTAPTDCRTLSGVPPRTAASGSARVPSGGSHAASAPASR